MPRRAGLRRAQWDFAKKDLLKWGIQGLTCSFGTAYIDCVDHVIVLEIDRKSRVFPAANRRFADRLGPLQWLAVERFDAGAGFSVLGQLHATGGALLLDRGLTAAGRFFGVCNGSWIRYGCIEDARTR